MKKTDLNITFISNNIALATVAVFYTSTSRVTRVRA